MMRAWAWAWTILLLAAWLSAGSASAQSGAETPGEEPKPRSSPGVGSDPARSDYYLALCSAKPGSAAWGRCLSYVDGASSMHAYWAQLIDLAEVAVLGNTPLRAFYCHPEDTTDADAAAVWVKWLNAHPDEHGEAPIVTLLSAFREAYPCK
jgi:hypothetical protein